MTSKRECKDCTFWAIHGRHAEDYRSIANGDCRIAPPSLIRVGDEREGLGSRTAWPVTAGGDFCGKFEQKEG